MFNDIDKKIADREFDKNGLHLINEGAIIRLHV